LDIGPTVTMTTNKSGRDDEDEDITIGNDDEEEVLDGNLFLDDDATTQQPSPAEDTMRQL